jgi:hypothetical protein
LNGGVEAQQLGAGGRRTGRETEALRPHCKYVEVPSENSGISSSLSRPGPRALSKRLLRNREPKGHSGRPAAGGGITSDSRIVAITLVLVTETSCPSYLFVVVEINPK